jgi:phenylalanyl-tRNA synthetase alpha chain
VSSTPPIGRDLSIAVGTDYDVDDLGDKLRDAQGADADEVEEVTLMSEVTYAQLPAEARSPLGMSEQQRNLLVRVIFHLERALTDDEANVLRDRISADVCDGTATSGRPAGPTKRS